jgi:hypothetical protein
VTVTAWLRGCTCPHPFRLAHDTADGLDTAMVNHTHGCPALDAAGVIHLVGARNVGAGRQNRPTKESNP